MWIINQFDTASFGFDDARGRCFQDTRHGHDKSWHSYSIDNSINIDRRQRMNILYSTAEELKDMYDMTDSTWRADHDV